MTFIEEAVISGFIGKIISDCIDISRSKIKKADKNRKLKKQNLQARVYQVIIDAINEVTCNKYKSQDALYDAAEDILNGLKRGNYVRIEAVKHGLSTLISDVDNDKSVKFIEVLRMEICKECNYDLYKEILIMLSQQTTVYNEVELQQIKKQLNYIIRKLDENDRYREDNTYNKAKSRTQEYADKWNSNMFLNDFDKRDENAGANVKLSEVYLEEHLPHYIWGKNEKPSCDLKTLLSDYIDKKNKNDMLLILGQPGIGKSTLITWIAANFVDKRDDILVYQFASDLKNVNGTTKSNISEQILDTLDLVYDDLNGKILILDGFDEVSIVGNRSDILDQLYDDYIYSNNIQNFNLIITCRENYIRGIESIKCKYITLQPWDEKQIQSFVTTFLQKIKCDISKYTIIRVIENKDIFGIPLILYMVLALNISIDKEGSIVDIYDKIFSLEGGIYDRCIEHRNFAGNHRIGDIKEQIHIISEIIAIWMFENKPEKAYISREKFEEICDIVIYGQNNQDLKQDILIGNYFKMVKHCEGVEAEEIYFVHRSIYEYFVAETIYSSIENAIIELSEESKKALARNIAIYLKKGQITNTIGEYLQFKLLKLFHALSASKKEKFYNWWEEVVEMMMENGMFYFTEQSIQTYNNILEKESNCFVNLLEILRMLIVFSDQKYILRKVNFLQLERFLRHCLVERKNMLSGDKFLNFSKLFLNFTNLSHEKLMFANFREAKLIEVNLEGAYLKKADFRGATLEGVILKEAYLEESIWDNYNIQNMHAQLKEANFNRLCIKVGNNEKTVHRSELFPNENNTLNI